MGRDGYTFVDDLGKLESCLKDVQTWNGFAMDCEGINLSRSGELCIMQLRSATATTYVIDVYTLGETLFKMGMKAILESTSVVKYMYDCRNDADALLHGHGVRLQGVFDLQLLVTLTMKNCRRVMGLGKAVDKFIGVGMSAEKVQVKKIFLGDFEIWKRRPIDERILNYCVADVAHFFTLRTALMSLMPSDKHRHTEQLIFAASENYSNYIRDAPTDTNPKYLQNAFFPERIIPPVRNGIIQSFLPGEKICLGCRRLFHRNELGAASKCRVCFNIDRQQPRRV